LTSSRMRHRFLSDSALTWLLSWATKLFLFVLPWHTVWIYKERLVGGSKWQYGTLQYYASEAVLWAAAGLFMIWFWRRYRDGDKNTKRFSWSRDRVWLGLCLVFALYAVISPCWAADSDLARQQALHLLEALVVGWLIALGPLSWAQTAFWFAAGAVGPGLLALGQFGAQAAPGSVWLGLSPHMAAEPGASIVAGETTGRWLRAYGSFSHPNSFSGYLVLVTSVFLRASLRLKRSYWSYAFVLLTTAAVFFTFSRSGWLGFLLSLILFAVYCRRARLWAGLPLAVAPLILFCLLALIYAPAVSTRLTATSAAEERSLTERADGYMSAFQVVRRHPWLGVGPGNYTVFLQSLEPGMAGFAYQPVHLAPLLALAELGGVGTAIGLSMLGAGGWFLYREKKGPGMLGVEGLLVIILPTLPLILLDHYLFSSYSGLLMLTVAGSAAVRLSFSTDRPPVIPTTC